MTDEVGKFDGWVITEEQVELINRGDGSAWSRFAFELFFWENYKRLRILAKSYLRNYFVKELRYLYEVNDCMHSLYTDGLQGYFHVELKPRYIGGAVFHSFRYMSVGGCEDAPEYKPRKAAA